MLIFKYTRKDAIRDGVLIDVTPTAKECSIKYPTAVTEKLWNEYIKPEEGLTGQSTEGRLWDTLFLFTLKARKTEGDEVHFKVIYQMRQMSQLEVKLYALCHAGDEMEPVITILLEGED